MYYIGDPLYCIDHLLDVLDGAHVWWLYCPDSQIAKSQSGFKAGEERSV